MPFSLCFPERHGVISEESRSSKNPNLPLNVDHPTNPCPEEHTPRMVLISPHTEREYVSIALSTSTNDTQPSTVPASRLRWELQSRQGSAWLDTRTWAINSSVCWEKAQIVPLLVAVATRRPSRLHRHPSSCVSAMATVSVSVSESLGESIRIRCGSSFPFNFCHSNLRSNIFSIFFF